MDGTELLRQTFELVGAGLSITPACLLSAAFLHMMLFRLPALVALACHLFGCVAVTWLPWWWGQAGRHGNQGEGGSAASSCSPQTLPSPFYHHLPPTSLLPPPLPALCPIATYFPSPRLFIVMVMGRWW